ncbi:NUDIX hydrolase [Pediococcus siamensis]|uniref:NUDIX hydrolase n=1 Tax=Pediococcus siamensis TaxID=381829 RepID=UPI0039A05238
MANYIKWIRSKVVHERVILNFSAGILTNSAGKVLLQKRSDKGTWGLIGGTIELGESGTETLVREFKEEAGIDINTIKLLNIYSKYFDSYPNGDKAQTITILYKVSLVNEKQLPTLGDSETLRLNWFNQDELKGIKIVNQQHEDMLQDFFDNDFPIRR